MSISNPLIITRVQSLSQTADDAGVALKIKCLGDPTIYTDPQVVLASHALLFYSNYAGSVLDTAVFQTGVTAGNLLLSNGSDDMAFLELAQTINASRAWACTLVCARPEDIAYLHGSTLDAVLGVTAGTANAKACATEAGTILYFDTSANTGNGLHYDVCFGPEGLDENFASFTGRKSAADRSVRDSDDFRDATGNTITGMADRTMVDSVGFVSSIAATSTYASGTSTINVYEATQSESVLIDSFAGGATTVAGSRSYDNEMRGFAGRRLIVRLTNSAALSAASLTAQGGFGTPC